MQTIFISGIGTDVGKTVAAAIIMEALAADYWKPVQAGFSEGTDSEWISGMIDNSLSRVHPEVYKLVLAASPHISARNENVRIDLGLIVSKMEELQQNNQPDKYLVIEGAGGLLVPLNDQEFVADLCKKMNARVILVSRNYLGSINHSLLTATACRAHGLNTIGWIFNDNYLEYEEEIALWSAIPKIASIPFTANPDKAFIKSQAALIRPALLQLLR